MDLEELRAFLDVVEAGSLLSAAEVRGVSRTTLKRRIEGLEARAGVALLETTSRGIVVTEAGQILARRGRGMMEEIGTLISALRRVGQQPEGVLRVVMPVGMPPQVLTPMLSALRATYPRLAVECRFADDPLAGPLEEIDLAIHFGDGPPRGPWRSIEVMRVRLWLVAHRDYLARRGVPGDPAALRGHELLAWQAPGADPRAWPLRDGGTLRVEPALIATDIHFVRGYCLQGAGIALVPDALFPDAGVAAEEVVPVLPDQVGSDLVIRVTVPDVLSETPKVKAVLEHAMAFLELLRATDQRPSAQGASGPHSSGSGAGTSG